MTSQPPDTPPVAVAEEIVQLTLRSGAQVHAHITPGTLTITEGPNARIEQLTWDRPDQAPAQLRYVDPDEIAALTTLHEPAPEPTTHD